MQAPETSRRVTLLLREWGDGDGSAVERLLPLVYDELRRIAQGYMRSERRGHTLQTTALVHEACIRLIDADVPWQDRGHFYVVAARAMRRILVDHARARKSDKRGGGAPHVELQADDLVSDPRELDVVLLSSTLDRLAELDPRKARIVDLHYFAGLGYRDIGLALDVSERTVTREIRTARAWLRSELAG